MSQLMRKSAALAEDNKNNVHLLYTGYLEKRNPVSGTYNKRFVVLTHEAVHWFLRTDGDDLFGDERGRIGLATVISVRILEEDANTFLIESADKNKRFFRASSPVMCEEWVSAVKSTTKNLAEYQLKKSSNLSFNEEEAVQEISILLVSHAGEDREVVLARNPAWDRLINVPNFRSKDRLLISTSNGGMVTLACDVLEMRSEGAVDFEVSVQDVTLASSLRMTVQRAYSATPRNSSSSFSSNSITFTTIIQNISTDRNSLIPFILSTMILFVGFCSLPYAESSVVLFFMFSIMNAAYCLVVLYNSTKETLKKSMGDSYNLRIHAHSFTSPDAPITSPEDEIPKRFIDGCEGDMKEARRRWDITRHWRDAEGLDKILTVPQPHFFTIKAMAPHYHFGRGRQGHLVYWERPTELKFDEMYARGITLDDLYRHWLFVTEYQWQVMLGGDETAKSIAVLDGEGINMSYLSGDPFVHMKRTLAASGQHYPERSFVIYVVNAPAVLSMMWRIVKGMVHPNTQKKVRILSKRETLEGLQEHIDISQIPEYYGGQAHCDPPEGMSASQDASNKLDSCRFFGPETLALNEYVRNINRQATNAPQNPFDLTSNSTSKKTHLPPGPQGHLSQTALGTEANSSIMPPASEVTRSQRTMSMRIDTRKQAVGIVTGNARTDSYSVYSDSVSNP